MMSLKLFGVDKIYFFFNITKLINYIFPVFLYIHVHCIHRFSHIFLLLQRRIKNQKIAHIHKKILVRIWLLIYIDCFILGADPEFYIKKGGVLYWLSVLRPPRSPGDPKKKDMRIVSIGMAAIPS